MTGKQSVDVHFDDDVAIRKIPLNAVKKILDAERMVH